MIWLKSNWEAQNLKSSSSTQVPKVPMNKIKKPLQ